MICVSQQSNSAVPNINFGQEFGDTVIPNTVDQVPSQTYHTAWAINPITIGYGGACGDLPRGFAGVHPA